MIQEQEIKTKKPAQFFGGRVFAICLLKEISLILIYQSGA